GLQLSREVYPEPVKPCSKLVRGKHPAQEVGFGQAGREKIFTGRLVINWPILVAKKECARSFNKDLEKAVIPGATRIIDHQPQRKCRLAVLAGAHRILKPGQPLAEAPLRRLLKRPKMFSQFAGRRLVRLAQLQRQLQKPRQPVRTLETLPSFSLQISHFAANV